MHATNFLFSEVSNEVQWPSSLIIKEKKSSLDTWRISAAYTLSPDTNDQLYLAELQFNIYVKTEKWADEI